ncbi:MAG: hypothetical protein HYS08_02920 [Chlamydiae bacterium]|nr:hypothetical protein [Chlamydiota bacterium]
MWPFCQKAVAFFLSFSLVFFDLGLSHAQSSEISSILKSFLDAFSLAPHLGEIVDRHFVPDRPVVFIIEDTHCNFEVQKNIKAILQVILQDNQKEPLPVFLEGEIGKTDYSLFTSFPDQEILRKVQDQFIKQNDITGAESFLMTNGKGRASGFGVEDVDAYVANVQSMGKLMQERRLYRLELRELDRLISNLEKRILSKTIQDFLKKKKAYSKAKIKLEDYLKYIGKMNEHPFSNHPTIQKFLKINKLESSISKDKLQKEYLFFLETLQKKLPMEDLAPVLQSVLEFRSGKIEEAEHDGFISRYENILSTDQIPNLSVVFKREALLRNFSWTDLQKEIRLFEEELLNQLVLNPNEKRLLKIERVYKVFKDMISMEADKKEVQKNINFEKDFFKPLQEVAKSQNIPFLQGPLPGLLQDAKEFYRCVLKRDKIIFEKMMSSIQEKHFSRAVLVVGGFHSQGQKELIKKGGVGYISIAPQSQDIQGKRPYFEKMKQLFSLFHQQSNTVSPPLFNLFRNLFPAVSDETLLEMEKVVMRVYVASAKKIDKEFLDKLKNSVRTLPPEQKRVARALIHIYHEAFKNQAETRRQALRGKVLRKPLREIRPEQEQDKKGLAEKIKTSFRTYYSEFNEITLRARETFENMNMNLIWL